MRKQTFANFDWFNEWAFLIAVFLMILSVVVAFQLLESHSYNEQASKNSFGNLLLLLMFMFGLLLPIWVFKQIVFGYRWTTIIVSIFAFSIGFVLFVFTYGWNVGFIFPIVAILADFVNGCSSFDCLTIHEAILAGVVYAAIGNYLIILFHKRENKT